MIAPEHCTRCSRILVDVHPYGICVVDMHSQTSESETGWETGRAFLCALCIVEFGEFMCPGLADQPNWISEKDQVLAEIKAHMEGN